MNDLLRGTPYDKDPEPHAVSWWAWLPLVIGLGISLLMGLEQ